MKKKCDAEEIRKLKEENTLLKIEVDNLKSSSQTGANVNSLKKENEELVKHFQLTTSVLKKEIDGYKLALQVSLVSVYIFCSFLFNQK